jgi:hypothetical protein
LAGSLGRGDGWASGAFAAATGLGFARLFLSLAQAVLKPHFDEDRYVITDRTEIGDEALVRFEFRPDG